MIVKRSRGPSLMSHKPLSNFTIVVVEDHDDTRKFLGDFLGHLGVNVVLARNASEGVEAVKTRRPNLVLCDIKMPGRDGFDVLSEIRALGPFAGGSVPVIAMSALVTHARAHLLSFQPCLPNRFTPDKVLQTVRQGPN